MPNKMTMIALVVAIGASLAGFPFESMGAHDWSGLFFVVWGVALFAAAALLAVDAGRRRDDLGAVGFGAVALYGLGTTLNSSLLARGMLEASVGIQPGIWAMLALGLLLVGISDRFGGWIRVVGVLAAGAHATAATALLFGAEMPHTGAAATEWAPLAVAIGKLLLWATLVGWIISLRRVPERVSGISV